MEIVEVMDAPDAHVADARAADSAPPALDAGDEVESTDPDGRPDPADAAPPVDAGSDAEALHLGSPCDPDAGAASGCPPPTYCVAASYHQCGFLCSDPGAQEQCIMLGSYCDYTAQPEEFCF